MSAAAVVDVGVEGSVVAPAPAPAEAPAEALPPVLCPSLVGWVTAASAAPPRDQC